MKQQRTIVTITLIALTSAALATDDLALEPCIDGGVSAMGTHATQYEEDLAQIDDRIDPFDELALEPCINGDVSPDGTAIGSVDAEPVIKFVQEVR